MYDLLHVLSEHDYKCLKRHLLAEMALLTVNYLKIIKIKLYLEKCKLVFRLPNDIRKPLNNKQKQLLYFSH